MATRRLITTFLLFATFAIAKTYEIAEPDIFDEVSQRKDKVLNNINKYKKEAQEKVANHKGEALEVADRNETYYIDPTYTLKESIPKVDKNGNTVGILYPKGFTFNPIKYTKTMPPKMIFFNPCDKKEATFVKQTIEKDSFVMLVSSGCAQKDMKWQDFGMSIYSLTPEVREKLQLTKTISVATVDKERIRVDVIKP